MWLSVICYHFTLCERLAESLRLESPSSILGPLTGGRVVVPVWQTPVARESLVTAEV